MRPPKSVYYMQLAHLAASRSTCDRLLPFPGVGAVVVRDDAIISTGYSGAPRGVGQCNDRVCVRCYSRFNVETRALRRPANREDQGRFNLPLNEEALELGKPCPVCQVGVLTHGHKMIRRYTEAGTFSEHCVLTVHAETNALIEAGRERSKGGVLYTTHLPCWDCAKLIVNSGIRQVVFDQEYQLKDSISLLNECLPDGLVQVNMNTGELTPEVLPI